MRPGEARPLVEPRGGALVHAFCRDWPGPRVNYSRYNAASREFFAAFEDALRGRSPVVERASIDEGYAEVELTGAAGLLQRLGSLAHPIRGIESPEFTVAGTPCVSPAPPPLHARRPGAPPVLAAGRS